MLTNWMPLDSIYKFFPQIGEPILCLRTAASLWGLSTCMAFPVSFYYTQGENVYSDNAFLPIKYPQGLKFNTVKKGGFWVTDEITTVRDLLYWDFKDKLCDERYGELNIYNYGVCADSSYLMEALDVIVNTERLAELRAFIEPCYNEMLDSALEDLREYYNEN